MQDDRVPSSVRRPLPKITASSNRSKKPTLNSARENGRETDVDRPVTSNRNNDVSVSTTNMKKFVKIDARKELLCIQDSILAAIGLEHQIGRLEDLLMLYLDLDDGSSWNAQSITSVDRLEQKLELQATFRTWSILHSSYVSRIRDALRTLEQNSRAQKLISIHRFDIPEHTIWKLNGQRTKTLDICQYLDCPSGVDQGAWQITLGKFISALIGFVSSVKDEVNGRAERRRKCMGRLIECGVAVESQSTAPDPVRTRIREVGSISFYVQNGYFPWTE